jgi:nucleoside-triphosphatase
MGRTLLLSGRPGVGKTTVIRAVVAQLAVRAGVPPAAEGFYTEEILGAGGRKGFRLVTLDGQADVMAHIDFKSRSQVGRYGVKVEVIDRLGAGAIRAAIEHNSIVVIDEIGKMELFSAPFQSAVLKAMSSSTVVLATVMQDNPPWVAALKALPQATVWEVTKVNRNALPAQVVAWLTRAE